MEHTPGPWEVKEHSPSGAQIFAKVDIGKDDRPDAGLVDRRRHGRRLRVEAAVAKCLTVATARIMKLPRIRQEGGTGE